MTQLCCALANMSEVTGKRVRDSLVVRARFLMRSCVVFPMVACLLAVGLPSRAVKATTGFRQTVVPADTPPTVTEYPIPTPGSITFQLTGGPDGAFWFCETKTDKIGRVTTGGLFTEFPLPTGSVPYAITGGPDGNLWFTEQGANSIGRITTTGTITHFSIPSAGSRPFGITKGPDNNIWFTEVNTSKIGRITTSGSFTEFPLPIAGTAPFQITPGVDGNVWFTEQAAGLISRITSTGTVTQFPIPTANSLPSGITPGPDGGIWFTEYLANKIGRVSRFGVFNEYSIPTPNSLPFAITAPGDGNLYYTQQGANAIQPFFPALGTFGSPIPTSGGPSGIATLPGVGLNLSLGYVAADANKLGIIPLTVTPPDCGVTLDKTQRSFDAKGRDVAILTGKSNCKPTATTASTWIHIREVGFVPENMLCAVDYSVEPNPSSSPRSGQIKVGDKYFAVDQAGATPLPPVNPTPRSVPSGGPGFKLRVNPGGSDSSSTITIEAAGFTGNSLVGWNGEERPTTLVSDAELSADISAADIATPGTVRVTVFDPSPGGGTSPDVILTITQGPDFALALDQSTVTAQAGTKARVTVNITRTGGFTGNVTVTPPDPADGIRAKPPDPITTTDTTASFKLKIGGGATPGSHQLIFKGKDDSGRERDVTLTVIVQ